MTLRYRFFIIPYLCLACAIHLIVMALTAFISIFGINFRESMVESNRSLNRIIGKKHKEQVVGSCILWIVIIVFICYK